MVIEGDGQVRTRPDFTSTGIPLLPATTQNYIVVEQADCSNPSTRQLVVYIKDGNTIKRSRNDGPFTTVAYSATDPPIGTEPAPTEVGSFAVNGDDVYYCDTKTIFRISCATGDAERPGVVGLTSHDYLTMGLAESPNANGAVLYSDFGAPFGNPDEHPGFANIDDPWIGTWSPRIYSPDLPDEGGGQHNPSYETVQIQAVGQKTLNSGFAMAWYDPKRRIYGRRSEVFALPYLFAGGPKYDSGVPEARDILSTARVQYSKILKTPTHSGTGTSAHPNNPIPTLGLGHSEYKVAIWFTRGFFPVANTSTVVGGGWWAFALWTPAMSARMNELLFLEGLFEQGLTDPTNAPHDDVNPALSAVCKKDDSTLYASGRYLDTYARPVPARYMTILPNGIAVYIQPRVPPTLAEELSAEADVATSYDAFDLGNYAEFSVKHPEQIGRNSTEQRDTVSPIANLRGTPLRTINSGTNSILLSNRGMFRIGFQRGVLITEIPGAYGIEDPMSFVETPIGMVWACDAGIVLMQGDQTALLDAKLGFSDWYRFLNVSQRKAIAIGHAGQVGQILIQSSIARWTNRVGDPNALNNAPASERRIWCYDYSEDFSSEFRGADINDADPMLSAGPANVVGQRIHSPGGSYPSSQLTVTSENTEVEVYVSEDVTTPKILGSISMKVGQKRTGTDPVIEVWALDHTDEEPREFTTFDSRTATVSPPTQTGNRLHFHQFNGMRGRMFRIRITSTDANWGIQELRIAYEVDETTDERSA
jgi:hypothetical protein